MTIPERLPKGWVMLNAFERRHMLTHALPKRIKVVAALKQANHPHCSVMLSHFICSINNIICQNAKITACHLQPAKRVCLMRVETSRNDNQIRFGRNNRWQ